MKYDLKRLRAVSVARHKGFLQTRIAFRLKAIKNLKSERSQDALWTAVCAFDQSRLYTLSGLPYVFYLKRNRQGKLLNEIVISRKRKSITKSTVLLAFKKTIEIGSGKLPCALHGPKQLGTFGASYIFPIFIELGVVKLEI